MERISSRWWSIGPRVSFRHGGWPWLLALISVLSASPANARLLQIIHSNDLHSFMEESEEPGHGGYAAVKATIEQAKREAKDRGIDSVVLDAGDFSEGTPMFFADDGKQSWRVMDAMGYDAV
ncbi:MAG: hypothetical protein KGQ59_07430, partial [Bdellovibrionales bacterium]|nr:hypothetical protein [Bdellovibrionales bacterium]